MLPVSRSNSWLFRSHLRPTFTTRRCGYDLTISSREYSAFTSKRKSGQNPASSGFLVYRTSQSPPVSPAMALIRLRLPTQTIHSGAARPATSIASKNRKRSIESTIRMALFISLSLIPSTTKSNRMPARAAKNVWPLSCGIHAANAFLLHSRRGSRCMIFWLADVSRSADGRRRPCFPLNVAGE